MLEAAAQRMSFSGPGTWTRHMDHHDGLRLIVDLRCLAAALLDQVLRKEGIPCKRIIVNQVGLA